MLPLFPHPIDILCKHCNLVFRELYNMSNKKGGGCELLTCAPTHWYEISAQGWKNWLKATRVKKQMLLNFQANLVISRWCLVFSLSSVKGRMSVKMKQTLKVCPEHLLDPPRYLDKILEETTWTSILLWKCPARVKGTEWADVRTRAPYHEKALSGSTERNQRDSSPH